MSRLITANGTDDANMCDAAVMDADVWCEEHNITDLRIAVRGQRLWRHTPTMKPPIWKCPQEWAV